MIVVSNTSPIHYLLLIDQIDLLPTLFGQVVVPQSVYDELSHAATPELVREWIMSPPNWLEVQTVQITSQPLAELNRLHPGERDVILLAEALRADLVIIDEKVGRQIASERGLNVTGLVGLLDDAAAQKLIDLAAVVKRLRQTSFRISSRILHHLLEQHRLN